MQRACAVPGEELQRLAAIAPVGDALISLASAGPAPVNEPGSARPTGEATFNHPSSSLGTPAVTVPLMAVGGMPVGVQIIGPFGHDKETLEASLFVESALSRR